MTPIKHLHQQKNWTTQLDILTSILPSLIVLFCSLPEINSHVCWVAVKWSTSFFSQLDKRQGQMRSCLWWITSSSRHNPFISFPTSNSSNASEWNPDWSHMMTTTSHNWSNPQSHPVAQCVIFQSAAAYFIESADAGSFTNGRQEFLSSFLQQGLITWKQYEEALLEERGQLSRVPSFLSTGNVSEDNTLVSWLPVFHWI